MTHSKTKNWLVASLLLTIVGLAGWHLAAGVQADEGGSTMLAHNVFFTLNDNSPEARQKLVDACQKYLTDHPGTVFFAAGTVADLDRPVNVRDWDVGLHMVFKDHKAHDDYQVAPRHKQFIEENKSNWKQVRVFDTDLRSGATTAQASR